MRELAALLALTPAITLAQTWDDPFTIYAKAQDALAKGDAPTAKDYLQSLKSREITPKGFWFLYGLSLLETRDFNTAKTAFEKALIEDPTNGQANFYLALLALNEGQEHEAQRRLQEAQRLLSKDDPLAAPTAQMIEALEGDTPKLFDLSLKAATQADSNALLNADNIAAARLLVDTTGAIEKEIVRGVSLQASVGALGALPLTNTQELADIDPFGFATSLSLEVKPGGFSLGASGFGKLFRRDLFQEPLLQEVGGLVMMQYAPVKLAYRITHDDFALADAEGTAFDQDNINQEMMLSLQSELGVSMSGVLSQAEADGNNLDRRGASAQMLLQRPLKKTTAMGLVDVGVMSFPNASVAREDKRLTTSLGVSRDIERATVSLSYVGLFNSSTDELLYYTRHLVTLGVQWKP